MSVIKRAENPHIIREENPTVNRLESEVQAAYLQVGLPRVGKVSKDWYGGVYESYQSNEC